MAAVIRVKDEAEAARGQRHPLRPRAAAWTRDSVRGEAFAQRMECGAAFVNAIVGDARLPFGGKQSGFGAGSRPRIHEFMNIKTVYVA